MISAAQKRASREYDKKNTKQFILKLNLNTDQELINHLNSLSNKQGYIKELILKDLKSKK